LQELGQEAHRLGRSLVRGPQIWWVLDTIWYPQLGLGKEEVVFRKGLAGDGEKLLTTAPQ
jgi:hypothetical protein